MPTRSQAHSPADGMINDTCIIPSKHLSKVSTPSETPQPLQHMLQSSQIHTSQVTGILSLLLLILSSRTIELFPASAQKLFSNRRLDFVHSFIFQCSQYFLADHIFQTLLNIPNFLFWMCATCSLIFVRCNEHTVSGNNNTEKIEEFPLISSIGFRFSITCYTHAVFANCTEGPSLLRLLKWTGFWPQSKEIDTEPAP